MTTEFRFKETSSYNELFEIASSRNTEMLDRVRQVAPSVHRIVKLRGRPPMGKDIDDILYDANDFEGANFSKNDLVEHLGIFSSAEATYYHLAQKSAYVTAGMYGLEHRTDDLIDVAKDVVSGIVWRNWVPEKGQDFIDLHKKIVSALQHNLIHHWAKRFQSCPFSSKEDYVLDQATEINLTDDTSPEEKPIFRFRRATSTLALPTIIARIDNNPLPIEKISALALIGYYPDGKGFTGVASGLGVKKETLSSALDRVIINFRKSDIMLPDRPIRQIVDELRECAVMKYPSGKNVEFDSPRLKLLRLTDGKVNFGARENLIREMSTARKGSTFIFSLNEIAIACGCNYSNASKSIGKLAATVEAS